MDREATSADFAAQRRLFLAFDALEAHLDAAFKRQTRWLIGLMLPIYALILVGLLLEVFTLLGAR